MLDKIAGSVISGGFGLGGAFLSNAFDRGLVRQQQDFQREVGQNTIKWRVDDAKRAGVHPLYALGAPSTPSYPIQIGDHTGPALQEMGQNIGGAVNRMLDSQARERHQLDMALGAAQLSESDARKEMYLSEAARNRQQPAAPMPGLGMQREGTVRGQLESLGQDPQIPGTGIIDLKPMDQVSSKEGHPDIAAGEHPGYQEMRYRGMPMLFPITQGESPEEILSEMSMPAYMGLLALNSKTYGGNWLNDFLNLRYRGEETKEFYPSIKEQPGMGRMYKPEKQWWEYFRLPGGYQNPRNQ